MGSKIKDFTSTNRDRNHTETQRTQNIQLKRIMANTGTCYKQYCSVKTDFKVFLNMSREGKDSKLGMPRSLFRAFWP